jgi:hypothetical protein
LTVLPLGQFSLAANLCHTQECLNHLRPEQVAACLDAYLTGVDFAKEKEIDGVWVTQAPWRQPYDVKPNSRPQWAA